MSDPATPDRLPDPIWRKIDAGSNAVAARRIALRYRELFALAVAAMLVEAGLAVISRPASELLTPIGPFALAEESLRTLSESLPPFLVSAAAKWTAVGLVALSLPLLWRTVRDHTHRQSVRVAIAATYFLVVAYANSFGKISHGHHMTLWAAIWLATIPTFASLWSIAAGGRTRIGSDDDEDDDLLPDDLTGSGPVATAARGWWQAQFLVCFFYFLSGLWKLLVGLYQLSQNEPNLFRLDAMPRQVAARLMQTNDWAPLGDAMVSNGWLSTPLLWGGVYIELMAIFVPFRPGLFRLWGVLLLGLHLGIGLSMAIWFWPNFFLIAIVFLRSPWKTPPGDPYGLRQLPIVRLLRRCLGVKAPAD